MVPKLDERKDIVLEMHMEIGHFGEQQTFAGIHYYKSGVQSTSLNHYGTLKVK